MQVLQKPMFGRVYKKLPAANRVVVDGAIRTIMENPYCGEAKVGDLAGVRVFKFRMVQQLMLLAYSYEDDTVTLTLLALGAHENFYRDLKKGF
jgi:mRNA-degrading endonuclease RelE of RelBE toxin-antitoxin system